MVRVSDGLPASRAPPPLIALLAFATALALGLGLAALTCAIDRDVRYVIRSSSALLFVTGVYPSFVWRAAGANVFAVNPMVGGVDLSDGAVL